MTKELRDQVSQLQALNESLKRHVRERTAELSKAKERLEAEVVEHRRTEEALRRVLRRRPPSP